MVASRPDRPVTGSDGGRDGTGEGRKAAGGGGGDGRVRAGSAADRAQIMLVGAIVLAVALVGVVVVLNSVLFTENVAPRGPVDSVDESGTFVDGIEADLRDMLAAASGNRSSVPLSALPENVSTYSRHVALARASGDVTAVDVSLNGTTSDTRARVVQEGGGQIDGKDSGQNDWHLIDEDNASEVTEFSLTLDGDTSASESEPFAITVSNDSAGEEWTLSVFKNPPDHNTVETATEDGTETTCNIDQGEAIHINETTVSGGDTTCPITFADGVTPPYTLAFSDGNKIEGNYSIVVNGSVPDEYVNTDCDAGSPCTRSQVVEAAFDVQYVTPELSYERTVRVAVPDGGLAAAGRTPVNSTFESGTLSETAWTGTGGGTVAVSDDASRSGNYSVVHDGPGGGNVELDGSLNTSGDDWVMVTWWAQEGAGGDGPDPGDAPSEDLVVEYRAANGSWVAVDRVNATGTVGRTTTGRVDLVDGSALHDDFSVRFHRPGADADDPWYLDDVVIAAGENE